MEKPLDGLPKRVITHTYTERNRVMIPGVPRGHSSFCFFPAQKTSSFYLTLVQDTDKSLSWPIVTLRRAILYWICSPPPPSFRNDDSPYSVQDKAALLCRHARPRQKSIQLPMQRADRRKSEGPWLQNPEFAALSPPVRVCSGCIPRTENL